MTFDMTETIKPKSDQLNADDLIGGDIVVKITAMKKNSDADQPVSVHFQGDNGKPYKPCKGMRRIMVAAWGTDAGSYVGKSMELFREPTVTFGKLSVGGIRISKMSDVKNPKKHLTKTGKRYAMVVTVSRNKKELYEFEEMSTASVNPFNDAVTLISTAKTLDELKNIWVGNAGNWKSALAEDDFVKLEKRKDDKKDQLFSESGDDDEISVSTPAEETFPGDRPSEQPDALERVLEG